MTTQTWTHEIISAHQLRGFGPTVHQHRVTLGRWHGLSDEVRFGPLKEHEIHTAKRLVNMPDQPDPCDHGDMPPCIDCWLNKPCDLTVEPDPDIAAVTLQWSYRYND